MPLALDCLAERAGFELLRPALARDVEDAISCGLKAGLRFTSEPNPQAVFQRAVAGSIRDIEHHPRGQLVQAFLRHGPYDGHGEIPEGHDHEWMNDQDVNSTIAFIYGHMINCFKGAIAELLAIKPCLAILDQMKTEGLVPENAQLLLGESVRFRTSNGKGFRQGADLSILSSGGSDRKQSCQVFGVVEVKSYRLSKARLRRQLNAHVDRLMLGIELNGHVVPHELISVGSGKLPSPCKISVVPSTWRFSRKFQLIPAKRGQDIQMDEEAVPEKGDRIQRHGSNQFNVSLKWSVEALAEAAYALSFWYMEKVGELLFSTSCPEGWEYMSAGEAGRNASKNSLYHAIFRAQTNVLEQRAIALYNTFGFGYALGMNFKDRASKRQMLWPQHLDEVLAHGETREGFAFR